MAAVLAEVAAESDLITFDSDSNVSRRPGFIGTENYDAGRVAPGRAGEAPEREVRSAGLFACNAAGGHRISRATSAAIRPPTIGPATGIHA